MVLRQLFSTVTMLAALSAFAQCTTTTISSAPRSDDGGAASDGGTPPLSCSGILTCVSKCADNDATCTNICVTSGSPEGQNAVNDIVTCVQQNGCMDATCYQSNCSAQLEACVTSAHTGGQPLNGGAPSGDIPADLVGKWGGLTDDYQFNADGSCLRSSDVGGTCETKALETCTAVAQGTTLSLYFTSGTFSLCGKTSTDPYMPRTELYTYDVNATTLHLYQQNCTGSFCGNGYDKF
jgi:hypothetical protein